MEVGKLADLTVLSFDPRKVPPSEIEDIAVGATHAANPAKGQIFHGNALVNGHTWKDDGVVGWHYIRLSFKPTDLSVGS